MTSRLLCTLILFSLFLSPLFAQKKKNSAVLPEAKLSQAEAAMHLRFLASDELAGRMTGTAGNDAAARYIAEQFRMLGVKKVQGAADYYQSVPLVKTAPPLDGYIVIGRDTLKEGDDVFNQGGGLRTQSRLVFAGYGLEDEDYKSIDAKGKIVAVQFGLPEQARTNFTKLRRDKSKVAARNGAVGMIELFGDSAPFPWTAVGFQLRRPSMTLADTVSDASKTFPVFLAHDAGGRFSEMLKKESGVTASVSSAGVKRENVMSQNVIGVIEGSDAKLKSEYVLLTAHFDHIGAGAQFGATPADTIFNGARDNGMGTVALLSAAKAFAEQPPARSVILVALTGEEVGLLGSSYYAAHPLVPLSQTVFNLNTDGAGFADTSIVTVIGLGRTSADDDIAAGSKFAGLTAMSDPVPEQGLFDRSDNVSFAAQGIPAPTFSPGFRQFDAEIQRYYHKPQDEAKDDFNFSYLLRYSKAFVHTARLVANRPLRPQWKAGDKYEAAGKKLYGEMKKQ